MDHRLCDILNLYGGKIVNDREINVCCPSHDDKNPSCQVKITGTDKLSISCWSDCAGTSKPFDALRKDFPHFFQQFTNNIIKGANVDKFISPLPGTFAEMPTEVPAKGAKITNRYAYCTKDNVQTGLVVYRYEKDNKKDIMPCHSVKAKNGDEGWAWKWPGKSIIYGLEAMATPGSEDKPVLIVEGEKCVNAAIGALGDTHVILSWSGGSNKWDDVNWKVLDWYPPQITLWPDRDEPGAKWALRGSRDRKPLAEILRDQGHKVRYIDPWNSAGVSSSLGDGYDIADLIEAGLSDRLPEIMAAEKDPQDYAQKEIYERCIVARTKHLDLKAVAKTNCGGYKACQSCCYNHHKLISHPDDISRYVSEPYLIDYVYNNADDKFYKLNEKAAGVAPKSGMHLANMFKYITKNVDDGKMDASMLFLDSESTMRVEGHTFMPNYGAIHEDEEGGFWLNSWLTSMAAESADTTGYDMWLELVNKLVPSKEEREHLMNWMAFSLQNPGKKINHQVMFISPHQGVGKDTMFVPLASWFGRHSSNVFPYELAEKFTPYLDGTKLLFIQEMEGVGKASFESKLKPMCASMSKNTLSVEYKGVTPFSIPNLVSIVAFSNKNVPMMLSDANDRRWFIIKYEGAADAKDKEFLRKLNVLFETGREMKNGVTTQLSPSEQSVLEFLMKRDVSKFNPGGEAPLTSAKEDVAARSKPISNDLNILIEDMAPPFNRDVVTLDKLMSDMHHYHPELARTHNLKQRILDLECVNPYDTEGANKPKKIRVPVNFKDKIPGAFFRPYVIRNPEYWRLQNAKALATEMMTSGSTTTVKGSIQQETKEL